jgi:pyruvate/2-oxoacid:ferredoxin oxidoreductase beta subunit
MEPKSKITSLTTYDERRKVLTHKSLEEKDTERGHLKIEAIETINEEGIKNTIKSLEQKRKTIQENIEKLEEVTGPTPKMTPELEELKESIKLLQLINHQETATEETKKKEQDQLKQDKEDLKKVEGDLREIKQAVGNRLKI